MIRIIIVDDLPIILEGIKVLINQIDGFEVVAEYKNGKELVEKINSVQADVILTDIDMPVMDGIAATKFVLTTHPGSKIIALSMYNDYKYYYEMITAGAKGFVLKQASVEELEKAIRQVYKGGNFFSKELLHNVILNIQNIEQEIVSQKKELLKLTERELELLTHICKGFSNKEIADTLFLSTKTIESHKARLMQKTNTKNNAGLIIWSIKNKIIEI